MWRQSVLTDSWALSLTMSDALSNDSTWAGSCFSQQSMYGFKSSVKEVFLHQDSCQDNLLILALTHHAIHTIRWHLYSIKKRSPNADVKLYRVLLMPKSFYDLASLSLYLGLTSQTRRHKIPWKNMTHLPGVSIILKHKEILSIIFIFKQTLHYRIKCSSGLIFKIRHSIKAFFPILPHMLRK